MNDLEFKEEVYELAFGDNAYNRPECCYSKKEVLARLKFYAENSAEFEEVKEDKDELTAREFWLVIEATMVFQRDLLNQVDVFTRYADKDLTSYRDHLKNKEIEVGFLADKLKSRLRSASNNPEIKERQ